MRSDHYSLPYSAQQAIRKGERAARKASALSDDTAALHARIQALEEALREAHDAIASLPVDALGVARPAFGFPEDAYPIRDELLANIRALIGAKP